LLQRSSIAARAAGNCCVLKLSSALKATNALLLDLVPKHEQRSLSYTRSFMD
jgi:aldehyde dehydrogenase (NAD+)